MKVSLGKDKNNETNYILKQEEFTSPNFKNKWKFRIMTNRQTGGIMPEELEISKHCSHDLKNLIS